MAPAKHAFYRVLCLLILTGTSFSADEVKLSSGETELAFESSFDKTVQTAIFYSPDTMPKDKTAPLLVLLHFYSGDRFTARNGNYYPEMDRRKWYLLCPELHGAKTPGGQTSFASLQAQHDAIDAIDVALAKYPNIDKKRIYLVGRSMGGMLSALLAAKYPDRFAGAVAGESITDMADILSPASVLFGVEGSPRKALMAEMGGMPNEQPFEYARRSCISFARNYRYVPIVLWSGTNDNWVPCTQTEKLDAEIRKYFPYQHSVYWLAGADHCSQNYKPAWECDQLQYFEIPQLGSQKTPMRNFPELNIVTDESKSFFYLKLVIAKDMAWAHVSSKLEGGQLHIEAENIKELAVDCNIASGGLAGNAVLTKMKFFKIKSASELKLTFILDGKVSKTIDAKEMAGQISF